MTKIDILTLKLIVPDDYQQFWVLFEWFLVLFHISDENGYCRSSGKKYAKMVLFELKTHFKKMSWVVFIPRPFLCKKLGQTGP